MSDFISKRNKVSLHGKVVRKEHTDNESAEFEGGFLHALGQKGVAVPKVISADREILHMEYIKGEPIPDFLSRSDSIARCKEAASSITHWFDTFYRAVNHKDTAEIRGDVNGRNFIITDSGVVGVDFEERAFGKMETDFGKLLAFIATYSYADDRPQRLLGELLLNCFVKRFPISGEAILDEKEKELEEMTKRRNVKYNLSEPV